MARKPDLPPAPSFQWVSVTSAFDKGARPHEATFPGFCTWLLSGNHKLAKVKTPAGETAPKPKLLTPAFSPVVLVPGETELISASILHVTALAIDFDAVRSIAICGGELGEAKVRVTREQIKIDLPALAKKVMLLGYNSVLYETASSTPEFPRVRLVVPLEAPAAPDQLPALVAGFLSELGHVEWVDLPTSTRPAGIHFVPMVSTDSIFTLITEGRPFPLNRLATPLEVPAPVGIEEARHKMHEEWSRADIETFDPRDLQGDGWMRRYAIDWKTLDMEKLFREGLGVEVEKRSRAHKGTGKKWRCQCPLVEEHSKVNNALDAVIFTEEDGYPGFYCPHQHELSLRQLVMGTEDGSPAVITEDLLLEYAKQWISPMAKESQARKIAPVAIWNYSHTTAPGQRMNAAQLITSKILKWEVKKDKAGNVISRKFIKDTYNLDKIFQHDELFGDLRYDLFKQAPVWKGDTIPASALDTILADLRAYIVENYNGACYPDQALLAALLAEANRRPFHPVYDYLLGLQWDGASRLSVLPSKIRALDNPMVPEYLRCFFVGAVARVLEDPGPHAKNGAKMDTCLVLHSDMQGVGKTTFFESLVPNADWFGSEAVGALERDALLIVHRHWIHEMGEVDALHRKHEAEKLKNFMSQRQDTFRLPYGRATGTFPRRFVLTGSTNQTEFLEDATGSRRWHIITVHDLTFDLEWVRQNRDQLWAEAVDLYRKGVKWWLSDEVALMHEENTSNYLHVNQALAEAVDKYLTYMEENGQSVFSSVQLRKYILDEMGVCFDDRSGQVQVGIAFKKVLASRKGRGLPNWKWKKSSLGSYYEVDGTIRSTYPEHH